MSSAARAPQLTTEIAGVIGVTSPSFNGSIAVCFVERSYLGLIGSMSGEAYTILTKDLEDGAGASLEEVVRLTTKNQ